MSAHNDGGPAFPGKLPIYGEVADEFAYFGGMTLRDYFAAKELAKTNGVAICDIPEAYARLADHCYRMADAMLATRGAA